MKEHGIAWLNPGDKIDGIFRQGETLNPITGCTPCSPGCNACYAKALHDKRHKAYLAGKLQACPQYAYPFETICFWPERLQKLASWKEPRMVFIDSMSDLFHEEVSYGERCEICNIMREVERHIYVVLTKRPENMRRFFRESIFWGRLPFPNLWLGVTVCNQAEADEKIPILLQIPAAKRFVSIEPCLEKIDLHLNCQSTWTKWVLEDGITCNPDHHKTFGEQLSWCIVGGESGPNARECAPGWIRGIVEQCQEASVPVFVKQMGREWSRWMELPDNPDGWRRGGFQDLCVREWPEANQ